MSNPSVYLAGPVEEDDNPRSWRDDVKKRFPSIDFLDPMDWQDNWSENPKAVISKELEACETNAILAGNIGGDAPRTVGTHHEISHALAHGNTRIAAVVKGRVPGFIEHRPVGVFESYDAALTHLCATPVAADGGDRDE